MHGAETNANKISTCYKVQWNSTLSSFCHEYLDMFWIFVIKNKNDKECFTVLVFVFCSFTHKWREIKKNCGVSYKIQKTKKWCVTFRKPRLLNWCCSFECCLRINLSKKPWRSSYKRLIIRLWHKNEQDYRFLWKKIVVNP